MDTPKIRTYPKQRNVQTGAKKQLMDQENFYHANRCARCEKPCSATLSINNFYNPGDDKMNLGCNA